MANVRWLTYGKLTQTAATTGTSGSRVSNRIEHHEQGTTALDSLYYAVQQKYGTRRNVPKKRVTLSNEMVGSDMNPTNRCTKLATLRRPRAYTRNIASCYYLRNALRQ